jgi:hypothetical protein
LSEEDIYETFCITETTTTGSIMKDLKENGSKIAVTNKNKFEYGNLRAQWMAYGSISQQIEHLKASFYEVVGKKNLKDINAAELEELLNGKPKIDVKDWKANTVYSEPYTKKHQVIQWFWKAVSSYNQTQLSHLVLFATGTSRIPAGGFAVLESNRGEYKKFTIQASEYNGTKEQLPTAHTCFNRVMLPMYKSYEVLKKNLDYVVNNEILGFGID